MNSMKLHISIQLHVMIVLLFSAPYASKADSQAAPYAKATVSWNGRFVFIAVPDDGDSLGGSGVCYEVMKTGELKKMWSIAGWYSYLSFLSNDGQYLIRVSDWPTGNTPSSDDLAIAFYRKGLLLRSYSTLDLVRDPEKVSKSVSHYEFLRDADFVVPEHLNQFRLRTMDDIAYVFDIRTGDIVTAVQGLGVGK